MTPDPAPDPQDVRRLTEEIRSLKRELEDVHWAAQKTNRGVRHLYRELENRNHELQQLDALKSEFISTVSHELRTPLAVIRESVAQTVEGIHGPVTDSQSKTLHLALKSVDRLTRLVTDLLDLSRIEFGKMKLKLEPVDLAVCAAEAAAGLTPNARKKGLALRVEAPAALRTYADRDKVEQILTNLLSNAIKFTDQGSVTLTVAPAGNDALIAVTDTGIGISEENLHRVFSKFEQFSRSRTGAEKGAGLGLAICKGLAELHGGSIRVESRLGQGSRFEARIPVRDAAQAAAEVHARLKDRAAAHGTGVACVIIDVTEKDATADGPCDPGLLAAARECLRRQEDAMIADRGRIWIFLPDVDAVSAGSVLQRIRQRVDAHLEASTGRKRAARYSMTLTDPAGAEETPL